jgi:hypothetical protein
MQMMNRAKIPVIIIIRRGTTHQCKLLESYLFLWWIAYSFCLIVNVYVIIAMFDNRSICFYISLLQHVHGEVHQVCTGCRVKSKMKRASLYILQ